MLDDLWGSVAFLALTIIGHIQTNQLRFVFSYNFYVYSITDKQFRSDLRTLFCRCFCSCSSSAVSSPSITAVVARDLNSRLVEPVLDHSVSGSGFTEWSKTTL